MAHRKYTVEIYPYLESRTEWHVIMSDEPNPQFTFTLSRPSEWALPIEPGAVSKREWTFKETDVFDVREVVFAIKTPNEALECFRRFGPWQVQGEERFATKADPIKWSQVQRSCEFFKEALLHRSIENLYRKYKVEELEEGFQDFYLWQPLNAELLFREPFVQLVRCRDVQMALRASVFLDRIEGFHWRRCARKDCGNLYKVSSKRERLYCKPYCAHLANMRDRRRRESADKPRKKPMFKTKPKR